MSSFTKIVYHIAKEEIMWVFLFDLRVIVYNYCTQKTTHKQMFNFFIKVLIYSVRMVCWLLHLILLHPVEINTWRQCPYFHSCKSRIRLNLQRNIILKCLKGWFVRFSDLRKYIVSTLCLVRRYCPRPNAYL